VRISNVGRMYKGLFTRKFTTFLENLLQGMKALEQWRNRLVERSKYLLTIASDGSILKTDNMFKLEVKKVQLEQSETKIVLDFLSENRKGK